MVSVVFPDEEEDPLFHEEETSTSELSHPTRLPKTSNDKTDERSRRGYEAVDIIVKDGCVVKKERQFKLQKDNLILQKKRRSDKPIFAR